MDRPEIMVSICCVTYNHENYIAEALNGFLMQETTFNYEIIVGEDCSTDNTRAIIEDYITRYPGRIQLVTDDVNVGGIKNQIRTFQPAKGKYIAMCDGDDYWIDPLKLQKQVDFMEAHKDSIICCHYSRVINEDGELVYESPAPVRLTFDYGDLLLGRKEETRICSLMLRNRPDIDQISSHDWYYKIHGADTFLKLYMLAKGGGKIYVLPEVMSVYRLHRNGVWSSVDPKIQKRRMISDFNILINHFDYSVEYKKELLKLYLRRFFLFDMKELNIQNALNTIKLLV